MQLHRNSYAETQKDKGEKKKRNAQQFFSPHPMYVHTPNAQQASLFTKASHDQKKKKRKHKDGKTIKRAYSS